MNYFALSLLLSLAPSAMATGRRASPARTAWNAANRAPLRVFQRNLERPGPNHHLARLERGSWRRVQGPQRLKWRPIKVSGTGPHRRST